MTCQDKAVRGRWSDSRPACVSSKWVGRPLSCPYLGDALGPLLGDAQGIMLSVTMTVLASSTTAVNAVSDDSGS